MISHNNPKAAPKEAQPLTFPKHPHPYIFSILCPRGRQHHATRPKPPEGHTTPTNIKIQHKCMTQTLLNVILATANLQINTNHAIIASIPHISRHNIPFPKNTIQLHDTNNIPETIQSNLKKIDGFVISGVGPPKEQLQDMQYSNKTY